MGRFLKQKQLWSFSVDLKYLTEANYEILEKKRGEVAYLLYQLIKSLKAK